MAGILASATTILAGWSADQFADGTGKPTIRIGCQSFPSGDLIVKNKRWLEEALPDFTIKWTKFDSGGSTCRVPAAA